MVIGFLENSSLMNEFPGPEMVVRARYYHYSIGRGGGMVDAAVSKTAKVKLVRVRVPPPAPNIIEFD